MNRSNRFMVLIGVAGLCLLGPKMVAQLSHQWTEGIKFFQIKQFPLFENKCPLKFLFPVVACAIGEADYATNRHIDSFVVGRGQEFFHLILSKRHANILNRRIIWGQYVRSWIAFAASLGNATDESNGVDAGKGERQIRRIHNLETDTEYSAPLVHPNLPVFKTHPLLLARFLNPESTTGNIGLFVSNFRLSIGDVRLSVHGHRRIVAPARFLFLQLCEFYLVDAEQILNI
jgi:hypothetical protein